MKNFSVDKIETTVETPIFNVEALHLNCDGQPLSHPYHRLTCPDWVNVLPITADGQAVLIKQPRAGSLTICTEIPGGMVDPHEKDPTLAAARELEEETGYTSQRILPVGALNPNPAIMNNRCHFFVALGCTLNPDRQHFPDREERIEVKLVPAKDLGHMVRTGQIDHSLCVACILLAGKYVDIGERNS